MRDRNNKVILTIRSWTSEPRHWIKSFKDHTFTGLTYRYYTAYCGMNINGVPEESDKRITCQECRKTLRKELCS